MFGNNDWRDYLMHSVKGSTWKDHKYVRIENGRYIYPEDSHNSGKYGRGNIDLTNLPMLREKDGSYETLDTFSTNIDGEEVLLNCIQQGPDGKAIRVSEDEAVDRYMKDGKHLGKFKSADEASNYAKMLDKQQESIRASRLKASNGGGKYAVVGAHGVEHGRANSVSEALSMAKKRRI